MTDKENTYNDIGDVPITTPIMTLRDWFASGAMSALVVRYGESNLQHTVKYAYIMADAMMEARK